MALWFTCPCGFGASRQSDVHELWSSEWCEAHRTHHLQTFPDADEATKFNLEWMAAAARMGERTR